MCSLQYSAPLGIEADELKGFLLSRHEWTAALESLQPRNIFIIFKRLYFGFSLKFSLFKSWWKQNWVIANCLSVNLFETSDLEVYPFLWLFWLNSPFLFLECLASVMVDKTLFYTCSINRPFLLYFCISASFECSQAVITKFCHNSPKKVLLCWNWKSVGAKWQCGFLLSSYIFFFLNLLSPFVGDTFFLKNKNKTKNQTN